MGKTKLLLLKNQRPALARFLEQYRRLMAVVGVSPVPNPVPPLPPSPIGGHWPHDLENGRIRVADGLAPPDLSAAIMRYWPRQLWGDAARVAYGESDWRDYALLDTLWRGGGRCGVRYWFNEEVGWATTEYSVGYFQINVCAHGGSFDHWKNADNNVSKAYDLFQSGGWRHWLVTARRLGLLGG